MNTHKPHLLLLDNRDSFVHNIKRYFVCLGARVTVCRSDEVSLADLKSHQPDALVISPGPNSPSQAGVSVAAITQWAPHIPVLGICLGHQAIGAAWGMPVVRTPTPMHGRASRLTHNAQGLFRDLPQGTQVGRYHALALNEHELPEVLKATAWDEDGVVMAVSHQTWPTFGVQFHPESVLTEHGFEMFERFLEHVG